MSFTQMAEDGGKQGETLVDRLLRDFSPDEGTFTVELPRGHKITFRRAESYSELQAFKRAAKAFVKEACDPVKNPAWADIIPESDDAKIAAFTVHHWSVEPTKFSQVDALKLCRAPWLLEHLIQSIDAQQISAKEQTEQLDAAKNESGATSSSETGSSSPETAGESTQTN